MRHLELTALTRFGLGPRPGDIDAASADPQGTVLAQCALPAGALLPSGALPPRDTVREGFLALRKVADEKRKIAYASRAEADFEALRMSSGDARAYVRDLYRQAIGARFAKGCTTDTPFVERLVLFWSNHFAINLHVNEPTFCAGTLFERDVIRPHVLGRFRDMLWAATTHPAMLTYLDNHRSTGPRSRAAALTKRKTGINENLARELLELHALGADGGYTQDDVIETAYVLSGWSGGFLLRRHNDVFNKLFHEPGIRKIMGRHYAPGGARQLSALIDTLAAHPATARHICKKLARHFVGDSVSATLHATLVEAFQRTDGDLAAVTRALVSSKEAWSAPVSKFVPPYDFMVASGRLLALQSLEPQLVWRSARAMAQQIWMPPSPAGWPDDDEAFSGGDLMLERVDFADMLARRFAEHDPLDLAHGAFAHTLHEEVESAIRRAESKRQAMVILLMSPALHRR